MSSMVHQPAADATKNAAPLAVRRRATAKPAGGVPQSPEDDFPILIRLPDLEKIEKKKPAPAPHVVARETAEPAAAEKPSGRRRSARTTELRIAETEEAAPETEATPAATTERAELRRRRRQAEPEASAKWHGVALQWGAILGVIVIVTVAYQLMHKGQPGKKESLIESAPPAMLETVNDDPRLNSAAVTPEPQIHSGEPQLSHDHSPKANLQGVAPAKASSVTSTQGDAATIADDRPEQKIPHHVADQKSVTGDANSSTNEASRPSGNLPVTSPNAADRGDMISQYPTTSPNSFRYRISGGDNPLDGSAGDGVEIARRGTDGTSREGEIRSARLNGIQNLPARERR